MGQTRLEKVHLRKARIRLRRIQHYEQVTRNVSWTCRFFGISRGQFYFWLRRYRQVGFRIGPVFSYGWDLAQYRGFAVREGDGDISTKESTRRIAPTTGPPGMRVRLVIN